MTAQPDLKPSPPNTHVEVTKAKIAARALIWAAALPAVIGGAAGYGTAWLQYGRTSSEAAHTTITTPNPNASTGTRNDSVRAMIITPREREKVGLCPAIRGTAPSDTGDAYWLAVQGVDKQGIAVTEPYLSRRITVDPARPPQWDIGHVGIAKPTQLNQDFYLLLIRTNGDLAQMFANNVGQYLNLPSGAQIEDRILVTQTAEPACPSSN